jgi:hypothetical protein
MDCGCASARCSIPFSAGCSAVLLSRRASIHRWRVAPAALRPLQMRSRAALAASEARGEVWVGRDDAGNRTAPPLHRLRIAKVSAHRLRSQRSAAAMAAAADARKSAAASGWRQAKTSPPEALDARLTLDFGNLTQLASKKMVGASVIRWPAGRSCVCWFLHGDSATETKAPVATLLSRETPWRSLSRPVGRPSR